MRGVSKAALCRAARGGADIFASRTRVRRRQFVTKAQPSGPRGALTMSTRRRPPSSFRGARRASPESIHPPTRRTMDSGLVLRTPRN